jgi:CubicO group peptidase (beta-lactamase class C family)/dienelactone hydrolase
MSIVARTSAVLAALLLSGGTAARAQRSPRDSAVAVLQRELPRWMEQGSVPGLSVAILRHGKTEWAGGFGVADRTTGRPVDEHTRFSAASLSKTVFAYAVLKLVDQGRLDLDVPLSRYVKPEVADDPRVDRITARIALSHRTGFPNWRPRGGALQLFFTPGERFSYSGEGIVYLQHAVEAIEGKPLEQVMHELVFQPLGMTESSYLWQPATAATAATGYSVKGRTSPLSATADTVRANAAASLNTTAHDYARFLEAVLTGRGLKPATLRAMETPQVAVDPTCTNCLRHAPDSLSKSVFWGLGWGIEQTPSDRYLWHWGDNGVFMAYVAANPADSSAVVMFDNSDTGLSVAPAVVSTVLGGTHPSFAWLDYPAFDSPAMRVSRATTTGGAAAALAKLRGASALVVYRIAPSAADSSIHRFDEDNYVVFAPQASDSAPLLVFLPGTGGRPQNTSEFANVAAHQGYRVIGLEYTDTPAVAQVCPRDPDPGCSEKVRRKRIYGDDVTRLIDDPPQESIVNRLTKLLQMLAREHPSDGWERYLRDGQPDWPRIAVSGLSQGAGMAAYIAQHTRVARVILFSSPWDNYGRFHTLAPWVRRGTGATPADEWFAAYHQREATASIIADAYRALHIPASHIRVFSLEPAAARSANPYHPSVVANGATPRAADGSPAYLDDWRFLLGDAH